MNEKDIEEKAEQFEAALEGLMCAMEELRKDRDRLKKLAERPRGRWIQHPEQKNIYGGKCIECSECGEKYMVQYIEDEKFCRNCGAKMEG